MEKLKDSESMLLQKLKEMPIGGGGYLSFSLRSFDLEIRKKKWSWVYEYKKATHGTIANLLKSLKKKGYITLDYTPEGTTKVIINQ